MKAIACAIIAAAFIISSAIKRDELKWIDVAATSMYVLLTMIYVVAS